MNWEIKNAHVVTPESIIPSGGLIINNNKIAQVTKKAHAGQTKIQLDLDGYFVFPGLVNAHDHLLGTYLPKVGDHRPYINWLPWDNDLKASPVYAERQQLDALQLYYMGTYRHLINGVTTVQDHIPHFVQDPFIDKMPIRIVSKFAMAHSIGTFALNWGDGVKVEYAKAVKNGEPFITHCSEGFDAETIQAVSTLQKDGALGPNTVLIHGIAFSDSDIELLAKKKVNVVWCPDSNLYMFNKTTNIKGLLEAGINVSLGTDSPMSGSVNMFEELKVAKQYYEQEYDEEIPDELLIRMVTLNPARALFVDDTVGSLEEGKLADFFVLDGQKSDPYKSLVNAQLNDIKLVVVDGKPHYGDEIFKPLFETMGITTYDLDLYGANKICSFDLAGFLQEINDNIGFKKDLAFLPFTI